MVAFKTGLGFRTDLAGFIMNPFVPATDLSSLYNYVENGKIKSAILDDVYKEGIRFIQKLYREKLLDEEIFTLTAPQIKMLTGNPTGNRIGAIQDNALSQFTNISEPGARDEYEALAPLAPLEPLKGLDGVRRTPYFKHYPQTRFVISSNCKNIEAAVRLGDLLLTNPFSGEEEEFETYLNIQYAPILITVVGTFGQVIITFMCAFPLAKLNVPGGKIYFKIIVLSLMFSTAVTAIPNYLIMSRIGFIDTYFAVIISVFGNSLGLYLMKQFMEQISDSLLEASLVHLQPLNVQEMK